jgi:uncharacterized membrane protein YtjA (UPF0391 family)
VILFPHKTQILLVSGPGTFVPGTDCFGGPGARVKPRLSNTNFQTEVLTMLSWVVTFLVIALIAGVLGFGGIAGTSIEIAKVIFFIAIVLFLVSAVLNLVRGRTRI